MREGAPDGIVEELRDILLEEAVDDGSGLGDGRREPMGAGAL